MSKDGREHGQARSETTDPMPFNTMIMLTAAQMPPTLPRHQVPRNGIAESTSGPVPKPSAEMVRPMPWVSPDPQHQVDDAPLMSPTIETTKPCHEARETVRPRMPGPPPPAAPPCPTIDATKMPNHGHRDQGPTPRGLVMA